MSLLVWKVSPTVPRTAWRQRWRRAIEPGCVRIFSMTKASRIAATMLSRREAAGCERRLMAVKYRPPDRCGRPLNSTLRSFGFELPVCVLLLPDGPRPRTPARDPKEPVIVFWVNDRSTLELDLRRSRRADHTWRQQSFGGSLRPPNLIGGSAQDTLQRQHQRDEEHRLAQHQQHRLQADGGQGLQLGLHADAGDGGHEHPARQVAAAL